MKDAHAYLQQMKTSLVLSPIITSITIVTEYAFTDRGYFRARLTLRNGDFLEVSEFFTVDAGGCSTQEYRYQWMDATQEQLITRWDNVPHHPQLDNYPHHFHKEQEMPIASNLTGNPVVDLPQVLKEVDLLLPADEETNG